MDRASVFPLFLIVLHFIATANALYGPTSPVVQLTESNFKSKVLNSKGIVLVEFLHLGVVIVKL